MSETDRKKLFLLFEKLKEDKKTLLVILMSFIGIFLIFLSEMLSHEDSEAANSYTQINFEHRDEKEELKSIIEKIEGVGNAEVMITYEGSSETVYAYDKSEQSDDSDIKNEQEHIILDKGNTEEGLPVKEIYPRVTGVAVVCEGGGSPTVKNEITQMLKALYGISSNNISISEMRS